MPNNTPSIIVFTDLDGTLLDHDTYGFDAARPALQALAARHIPVVPVSSKTRAELRPLMQNLGLAGAAIAENGAVICHANGDVDGAISIDTLRRAMAQLPSVLRQEMICFDDMSVDEIIVHTGLAREEAVRAAQREASMPFLWHGSGDAPPLALREALASHDLQITKGGRFLHIVPRRDKAAAMQALLAGFTVRPDAWALGDGPNDVAMLLAADRGALMANPHIDTQSLLPSTHGLYLSPQAGPRGWCDAIGVFLGENLS